jgi:hypothetical protein
MIAALEYWSDGVMDIIPNTPILRYFIAPFADDR